MWRCIKLSKLFRRIDFDAFICEGNNVCVGKWLGNSNIIKFLINKL